MASYTFDHIKRKAMTGQLNFQGAVDGSYKLALVTSGVFANVETGSESDKTMWSELSHFEITQSASYNNVGYTAPIDLINIGLLDISVNGFTQTKVSATSIALTETTIDADGCVIYKNDVNKTLIEAMDFGGKIPSNNGIYNIDLSNGGFLRMV